MKHTIFAYILIFFTTLVFGASNSFAQLRIGDRAPSVNETVQDISGRSLTLSSAKNNNGLIVIFSSNTCPWVSKWEDRYNSVSAQSKSNGVGMIVLNPNKAVRDRGGSMDDMRSRARKKNYDFFYALDEDHKIADAFGATHTPEVFLFDKDLKLVYHGAIDDNPNSAQGVGEAYLSNAISDMISGSDIRNKETSIKGCRIKRGK